MASLDGMEGQAVPARASEGKMTRPGTIPISCVRLLADRSNSSFHSSLHTNLPIASPTQYSHRAGSIFSRYTYPKAP